MKSAPPRPLRCAIYTRKSTEHNLDLAFNSLDAQREACEAYVKSQAHEGWRLWPEHYDDGGLSGASLDRPALQQMLEDVRSGKIDIIVVYKVDRLTRSLADFAKLVEAFDAHGVSFVSVTQSFNTTSSMGRLTLNVLLSFAQFEREVIGERVRDKIAASKRKGIWVGGPVPLGYRVIDKKLVAVPEEVTAVRTIFERYLALGSIRLLSEDLAERGFSPRPRRGLDGDIITGARFMIGPLGHILKNRCYIGEVVYQGQVHQGEHQPVLDRSLFDAVQARLAEGAINRTGPQPSSLGPSLLIGLLYDNAGNRMTPSHANKKGVRYRYYVSQAVLQNRKTRAGTITRVSAPEIEDLVSVAIRKHLDARLPPSGGLTDRDFLVAHVKRVVLHPQEVGVTLRGSGNPRQQSEQSDSPDAPSAPLDRENEQSDINPSEHVLIIPRIRAIAGTRRGITSEPASQASLDPRTRDALLIAIAKARSWMDDLVAGRVASFEEIAQREGKVERHVRLLAPLALVSPKIITAIVNDCVPSDLTVTSLARALPHSWAAQEQAFRIG